MANTGLLAHFIRRDRKKQGITKLPTWVTVVGLSFLLVFSTVLLYSLANKQRSNVDNPSPKTSVEYNKNSEVLSVSGNPNLQREGEKIVFTDTANNYYLDFSSLPEVQLTDRDSWTIYEFEMYERYGEFQKSIARFGLSELMDNPSNQSLRRFAQENYSYESGERQKGAWGILVTSPMEDAVVGNKYNAIRWSEESLGENGFFFENYLFNFEDKLVLVRMVAWDKSIFDENKVVLEEILTTFKTLDSE